MRPSWSAATIAIADIAIRGPRSEQRQESYSCSYSCSEKFRWLQAGRAPLLRLLLTMLGVLCLAQSSHGLPRRALAGKQFSDAGFL